MKKIFIQILSIILTVTLLFSSSAAAVSAAAVNTPQTIAENDSVSLGSLNEIWALITIIFKNVLNSIRQLFGMKKEAIIEDIVIKACSDSACAAEIKMQCIEYEYYLFLPSCVDKDMLIFDFSTDKNISINNNPITPGEQTDILKNLSSFTLRINSNSYKVKIIQSQNTPAMFIATESGSLNNVHADKEYKEPGSLVFVKSEGVISYDNTLDYIKGRGNTSWSYSKKGYNIKLTKSTDIDNLGKTKKYSLIPSQIDKSLLRNQISYDLAKAIGSDFAPMNDQVELFINGEYRGTYLLVVKNEIDSAAINITNLEKATEKANELELDTYAKHQETNSNGVSHIKYYDIPTDPADITGGYLLELDHSGYSKEASGFTSKRGQRVVVKSPEYASKAQIEYISAWYQGLEDAAFSATGYNDENKHYSDYIDVESFATYYMFTEYVMNGDSNITSVFMYKDSDASGDGKLHAGPVWDFDSALGNNGGVKTFDVKMHLTDPNELYFCNTKSYKTDSIHIYTALFRQAEFRAAAANIYKQKFVPALNKLLYNNGSDSEIQTFDSYANALKSSATMNFTRWQILNTNPTRGNSTSVTYDGNVKILKQFMTERKAFLDKIIDGFYEDYIYIFIQNDVIYGVTSFEDPSVRVFKGSTSTQTVTFGGMTFKVV